MILIYYYVERFRNIQHQEVSLSKSFMCQYKDSNMLIEQRYDSMTYYVYQLLKAIQQFDDDKLLELERIEVESVCSLKRIVFGKPKNEASRLELNTNMKYDLIGY